MVQRNPDIVKVDIVKNPEIVKISVLTILLLYCSKITVDIVKNPDLVNCGVLTKIFTISGFHCIFNYCCKTWFYVPNPKNVLWILQYFYQFSTIISCFLVVKCSVMVRLRFGHFCYGSISVRWLEKSHNSNVNNFFFVTYETTNKSSNVYIMWLIWKRIPYKIYLKSHIKISLPCSQIPKNDLWQMLPVDFGRTILAGAPLRSIRIFTQKNWDFSQKMFKIQKASILIIMHLISHASFLPCT